MDTSVETADGFYRLRFTDWRQRYICFPFSVCRREIQRQSYLHLTTLETSERGERGGGEGELGGGTRRGSGDGKEEGEVAKIWKARGSRGREVDRCREKGEREKV